MLQHARDGLLKATKSDDINYKTRWLGTFVRPAKIKVKDTVIWTNFSRNNAVEVRKDWGCTWCKCNPNPLPHSVLRSDPSHKFKSETKRRSKYSHCPDYAAGALFRKQVLSQTKTFSKIFQFYVSITQGIEL